MTENSLQHRKYVGGLFGARGYEFEKSYILSQLPDWLHDNNLSFFQQELWSDLELFFESGFRWLIQIKNHPLELAEFREVIRDFQTRHDDGQNRYDKFVIISTGLAGSVRAIRNILERWSAVEHLAESEIVATRTHSAAKVREHGLAEFENFLFANASKVELNGDANWVADESTVRKIFCSKLITDFRINQDTAENLYLRTLQRLSSERGTRIDLAPFREELLNAANIQPDRGPATVPFILPQLDSSTFTGRVYELLKLENLLLNPAEEKLCSIAGLVGSGGIGKSALACHFAELNKEAFPSGVIGLRVDGKTPDAIAREFARLCGEEIVADDQRDAATIMQEVFAHRRMLLIFDNAEDVAIQSLRPGGTRCAVIITTRDRQLPSLAGIPETGRIDLPPLLYDESLILLRELIGSDRVTAELNWVDRVMSLVGYLPLALQIVGATLQIQKGRSIESYAASLAEERERLGKLRIRGAAHLDVRASFALSLKLLEQDEIEFFASLSVCAQDGFSVESAMAAGGCEEGRAHEWLAYLYRLSLLNQPQMGTNRFVFHPLIRVFASELAIEHAVLEEAAERHAHFFVALVKSSNSDDEGSSSHLRAELDDVLLAAEWLQRQEVPDYDFVISLQPFLQQSGYWEQATHLMNGFLSVAEHQQDWRAIVQFRIQQAKYLSLLGKWHEAETALNPVSEMLVNINVASARQRCEAMWLNTLGGLLQRQGRFPEAADAFHRSSFIEEEFGNQRGQAKVLNSLGSVLQRQGDFEAAANAFRKAADIEKRLGNDHGQAMVLNSLGGVLQRQGRFDEAVDAFQRSFETEQQIGDKRGQAMVLNSLGGALQRQGSFDEAFSSFQQSYEIEKEIGNQRGQAMVLNSLGGVLQRQGRFDEAVDAFRRSYEIEREIGNQRGQAMVLNSLGGVLQRQGSFDEAVDAFQRSYEISEPLGDQRSLAMVLNSLGGVLQRQGRFDEAVDAFQRSYEISEPLGDQRSLAMVLNSLGGVLQRQGRFDEAVDAFQRSYEISEPLGDQRSLAMVLNSLGGVLQRQGRFDEAVDAFQRSYEISEPLGDQRSLAMVLNSLGGVLQRQGRFDEAVDAFQRSYDLLVHLKDQRGQAMVLNSLGGVLQRLGRFDEAVDAFQCSVSIGELIHDRRHLAMVLNSLGGVLQRQGRFDEAVDAFQRSYEIEREIGNQRGQAMVLNSLGGVLQRQGRFDEAVDAFQRSYEISEPLGDQRSLAMVLNSLGGVLQRQGRFDEAVDAFQRSYDLLVLLKDQRGQAMVLNSLGGAYQRQGRFEDSLKVFQRSKQISTASNDLVSLAMVHFGLGKTYLSLRNVEKSVTEFQRSFEINEHLQIRRGISIVTPPLVRSLKRLGRNGEALDYCRRALLIMPNDTHLKELMLTL